MLKMRRIFVPVFLMALIFPCPDSKSEDLSAQPLTSGIMLGNMVNQARLLHKLIESGIKLYVSNEGTIYYQEEYESIVENAQKDNGLTYHQFKDDKYATLFIALLELNNIEYSVVNYCNIESVHVYYDVKYEEKIKNEIRPKFMKAIREGIKININ